LSYVGQSVEALNRKIAKMPMNERITNLHGKILSNSVLA
jgi:hypothetical protein